MKYFIYVKGTFKDQYDDSTIDEMNIQLEKLKKKHGEGNIILAKVPSNIKVGYEIYRGGKFYGDIVAETESLWHIRKPGSEIPSPFCKETFESRFVDGFFDAVEYIEKEEKLEVGRNGKRRRSSSTEGSGQVTAEEGTEGLAPRGNTEKAESKSDESPKTRGKKR